MKKAFTFIELTFVIAILGIIAAVVLPRMNNTKLAEAADHIVSQIRYAQHLALVDNQYSPTDATWYKKRWQFQIASCAGGDGYYYVIGRNIDAVNNIDKTASAINPYDGKRLYVMNTCDPSDDESESVLLSKNYGVTSVSWSGCGDTQSLAFDHLGRPLATTSGTNLYNLLRSRCRITFQAGNGSFTIVIEPETGFTHIASFSD